MYSLNDITESLTISRLKEIASELGVTKSGRKIELIRKLRIKLGDTKIEEEIKNSTEKRCTRCTRMLPKEHYFYKNKDHATCEPCAEKIKKGKTVCFCGKSQPFFGYEDQVKPSHCAKCRLPGMVDILHKKCPCGKNPTFNYKGETKGICCGSCKLPLMVNVTNRKCPCGSGKRLAFNYKGETKGVCCSMCKSPSMMNITGKRCPCGTRPSFNYAGETRGICCNSCKSPSMVNVGGRRCFCRKSQPSFNYPGETRGTHCSVCKLESMIDVVNKRCFCRKSQPHFNYPRETKGTHCSVCKLESMIDVVNKRCFCGESQPRFNYPGETKGVRCGICKLESMIDVTKDRCSCGLRARYGFPGARPSRCSKHKEAGMTSNPRARCKKKDCKNVAEYGILLPIHCSLHKDDNDINLCERKCVCCDRIDVVDEKGLSINFCTKAIEFSLYKKRQHVKEKRVLDVLTRELGQPYIFDKFIPTDCNNKKRPDIIYIFPDENGCPSLYIIVEVDEKQHKYRKDIDEHERMKCIFTSVMGENLNARLLFIRYNPDGYKDRKGRLLKTDNNKREEVLLRWLKYLPNNFPKEKLSVLFLFYDGYEDSHREIHSLDPYDICKYECKICDREFFSESHLVAHQPFHYECPTAVIEDEGKKMLISQLIETEVIFVD